MNDVTDELVTKLYSRRDHGTKKYGKTLLPFDGRNTEYDIEEELLDALVYVTKMRMEREEIADLLIEARWTIESYASHQEEIIKELRNMTVRLQADVPRIGVPAARHLSGGPMERLEDMEKS